MSGLQAYKPHQSKPSLPVTMLIKGDFKYFFFFFEEEWDEINDEHREK